MKKKWKERSNLEKGVIIVGGAALTVGAVIITRKLWINSVSKASITLSANLIKRAKLDGFAEGVVQGMIDGDNRGFIRGLNAAKSSLKTIDFNNPIIKDLLKKYGFNAVVDYVMSTVGSR
jgi:hypothetical protein